MMDKYIVDKIKMIRNEISDKYNKGYVSCEVKLDEYDVNMIKANLEIVKTLGDMGFDVVDYRDENIVHLIVMWMLRNDDEEFDRELEMIHDYLALVLD
ncbi:hypothetical protein DOK78_002375 [Enterococcus sp. DIV2402]|uniref:Phage protein n=2 Tax=Candidatus Enterococcus lowellii TaxID=2230877 RepID=A0ABZ2SQB8_9ENTE